VITKGELKERMDGMLLRFPLFPAVLRRAGLSRRQNRISGKQSPLYLEPDEDIIPGKGARFIEIAV